MKCVERKGFGMLWQKEVSSYITFDIFFMLFLKLITIHPNWLTNRMLCSNSANIYATDGPFALDACVLLQDSCMA